jgi:sulfate adenylyltransferase subunit 1
MVISKQTAKNEMELLKFITCGSVDDGKSTLIGRLLYDSKAVSSDILNAIEAQTRQKQGGKIDLSLLTDGLRAEREQGITIDVAYKYFTSSVRKFIIADTPGHIQYTRNMVTGASHTDAAIVLIDARKGVIEQTIRHSLLVHLLGIPHLIVAINKMDLVDFDKHIFDKIVFDYQQLATSLGIKKVRFVPVSALNGDNVVHRSDVMRWYTGDSLLKILETLEVAIHSSTPRFQVQYVIRPRSAEYPDYRGYAGQVLSGTYRVGDKVKVLPSDIDSQITFIEVNQKHVLQANPLQSIVLHLKDDIDVSRGDSIVVVNDACIEPEVSQNIQATICWFDETVDLKTNAKFLLQQNATTVKAIVKSIDFQIDVNTLVQNKVRTASLNDVVQVQLRTARPLVFDSYQDNRQTGAFILIDEQTNQTVAAGMISK